MLPKVCALLIILMLTTGLPFGTSFFSTSDDTNENQQQYDKAHTRVKRGNIWGFFEKAYNVGRLAYDQHNDTKETLNTVYDLVADSFSDGSTKRPPPPMNTTESPDGSTTTTTERYRISKYEFGRILGRNYRGLKRLLEIEWEDALNQSKYTIREHEMETKNQIASYAEFDKGSTKRKP